LDITIFAKSSSQPELPYSVNFIIADGMLCIHCSCPAGIYGQLCKHKISFIEGDDKMLFDISQKEILADIVSTIQASPIYDELSRFFKRKIEIEKIQRELKKELKDMKFDLASKLKNGIRL
jgi:hypothetical protein